MSDTVPTFSKGNRVRIMQTTQMEKLGWANVHGTVTAVRNSCIIIKGDDGFTYEVDATQLAHE